MIQSPINITSQKSLGFESLARFSSKLPQPEESEPLPQASSATEELTAEQAQQIAQLKQIDRQVRAHEQAHISVGADLILSGPSFTYTTGPDKQRYAVAGEVSIDTSPGRTPEETIPKAQHIRATALAPADPSPEDHSVAAQANRLKGEALQQLALQRRKATSETEQTSSTALYRRVERSDGKTPQLGSRLDLFA